MHARWMECAETSITPLMHSSISVRCCTPHAPPHMHNRQAVDEAGKACCSCQEMSHYSSRATEDERQGRSLLIREVSARPQLSWIP